jgi:hypothetical protein
MLLFNKFFKELIMIKYVAMKTPKYMRPKFRMPFYRRWNANRHCNNKHYGEIENIISFTEYIANQKGSSISLNRFYQDNNSHQLNVKNTQFFDKTIKPYNNLRLC